MGTAKVTVCTWSACNSAWCMEKARWPRWELLAPNHGHCQCRGQTYWFRSVEAMPRIPGKRAWAGRGGFPEGVHCTRLVSGEELASHWRKRPPSREECGATVGRVNSWGLGRGQGRQPQKGLRRVFNTVQEPKKSCQVQQGGTGHCPPRADGQERRAGARPTPLTPSSFHETSNPAWPSSPPTFYLILSLCLCPQLNVPECKEYHAWYFLETSIMHSMILDSW